jgi:prepilin-type N-terminal cleavage/methylation domain-containing protein
MTKHPHHTPLVKSIKKVSSKKISLRGISMKNQQAFTLVELMIAMAIIAILATAGLSAYTGYIKKSRDTARAEIASNLNTAVIAYSAGNGGNPPASNAAFTQFLASA